MTPDDWRRLAYFFRVQMHDPYEPWRPFHQAADLFEEIAEREEALEDPTN